VKPNQELQNHESWVIQLPDRATQFLLGLYWIMSQWNPCDSTSVSIGSSLYLILIGLALGFFTSIDRLLGESRHTISLPWKLAISGFFAWMLLATYQVFDRGNFRSASLGFWQSVSLLGVASAAYYQFTKPGRMESHLRWMLGTMAGTVLYALYQYLISMPRLREEFAANPDAMLQGRGMVPGTGEAMQFANRLMSSEPMGPFALTNSLAGFIGPWLVVALGAIAWLCLPESAVVGGGKRRSRHWTRRFPSYFLTLWLLVVLAAWTLVLTKSRTAWIAAAVSCALLGLIAHPVVRRSWDRGSRYWSIAAPSLLVLFLIGLFVLWRDPQLLTEAGKSLAYRMEYWRGAWRLVELSPWLGDGPLQFQDMYVRVKELTASETPADPHNMWMEIGVWGGFPALAMAAGIGLGLVQRFAMMPIQSSSLASNEDRLDTKGLRHLKASDFGASFGLVSVVAFSFLSPELDTQLTALLFAGGCFYTYLSLASPTWERFVFENGMKIGLILCTFLGIHFLFSGGWMQPGNMNTALIGAVLGFIGPTRRALRREELYVWSPWIPLLAWIGLTGSFLLFFYGPENRLATWETDLALGKWKTASASEWAELREVHPWAPQVPEEIAKHAFGKAMDRRMGDTARREWINLFLESDDAMRKRSPRSWNIAYQSAIWNRILADESQADSKLAATLLERSMVAIRETAAMYPSSIPVQLQFALFAFSVGDLEGALAGWKQVEAIETTTPHEDRKLAATTVYLPDGLRVGWGVDGQPGWGRDPSGFVRAEPVFARLRSSLQLSE
jgi:O-antigen ligase